MIDVPDQSWVPERKVFLRRSAMVAAVTFLCLILVGFPLSRAAGFSVVWNWPAAALLTLGFMFEDVSRWRTVRLDRWLLSEGHLHHHDTNGAITIPLDKIESVYSRFGSRVVVRLVTGQKVELRYLKDAKMIAENLSSVLPDPPATPV